MPGAAGSGDLAERDGSAADNQPEEEEASDGSLDDEELEEGLIFGPRTRDYHLHVCDLYIQDLEKNSATYRYACILYLYVNVCPT